MRSLFGYLENFRPREFRSLVSYKFSKRNSVDLLRITSRGEREEKKSFVNLLRERKLLCPPARKGGRVTGKESGLSSGRSFRVYEEREIHISSIKPQLRAKEHRASDSPSSSSSSESRSFIKRTFNINQLSRYRQGNL